MITVEKNKYVAPINNSFTVLQLNDKTWEKVSFLDSEDLIYFVESVYLESNLKFNRALHILAEHADKTIVLNEPGDDIEKILGPVVAKNLLGE